MYQPIEIYFLQVGFIYTGLFFRSVDVNHEFGCARFQNRYFLNYEVKTTKNKVKILQ